MESRPPTPAFSREGDRRSPRAALAEPSVVETPKREPAPRRPLASVDPAERHERARLSISQALRDLGYPGVKVFMTSDGVIELRGRVRDAGAHDAAVAVARRVAPDYSMDVNISLDRP
jgi:hypothetical protein